MAEFIMGFDFGTKRIGVAIGQRITATATPLGIIPAKDGKPQWQPLDALIKQWQPAEFVVGLPLNMDGSESDMSLLAEKFARRLHGRFQIPANLCDERLTTFEARSFEQEDQLDAIAAKLILESYFSN